jgi:excisionase family DNA binding protein
MVHSLRDAAVQLGGLHESTLRRWIAEGRLEALRLGRRVVITEEELRRFVSGAQRRQPSHRNEVRG